MFENVLKKLKIATKRSWHASWQDKNSLESDILYEYLLDPEKVDLALAVLLGASDCPPRTYRRRSLMAEARPKTRMAGDKDLFASEATRSRLFSSLSLSTSSTACHRAIWNSPWFYNSCFKKIYSHNCARFFLSELKALHGVQIVKLSWLWQIPNAIRVETDSHYSTHQLRFLSLN